MVGIVAGVITFFFTTLLTIAGVGAAFILIPIFIALGIDIHAAMATALLLNALAMTFASVRFVRNRLVVWNAAIPILIVASLLSPLGAYVSRSLDRQVLLWLFVGFLLFAAGMMFFYNAEARETTTSRRRMLAYGGSVGAFAGFMGGLLGVGGGNFILPVLVWLGFDPKKASATTSFVVIFSSLAAFAGHASLGGMRWDILGFTAAGSALGAMAGAWLMTERLKTKHVKTIIGIVLLVITLKVIWDLAFH